MVSQDRDQRLARTINRLAVLIEDLIQHCSDPELAEYAREELAQVREDIQ